MICPKCNANNPKDPMQCIRCGYIFPEYLEKHNIDITRGSKEENNNKKRVDAIRNFTPKQNGINPNSIHHNEIIKEHEISTEAPTKLKMEKIIGRNGINRTNDIRECLKVFYVTILLIAISVLIINNI